MAPGVSVGMWIGAILSGAIGRSEAAVLLNPLWSILLPCGILFRYVRQWEKRDEVVDFLHERGYREGVD